MEIYYVTYKERRFQENPMSSDLLRTSVFERKFENCNRNTYIK